MDLIRHYREEAAVMAATLATETAAEGITISPDIFKGTMTPACRAFRDYLISVHEVTENARAELARISAQSVVSPFRADLGRIATMLNVFTLPPPPPTLEEKLERALTEWHESPVEDIAASMEALRRTLADHGLKIAEGDAE